METVILSLFIISLIGMVITIFVLIKQKVFFLNEKIITIFITPFVLGSLFLVPESNSDIKQKYSKEDLENASNYCEDLDYDKHILSDQDVAHFREWINDNYLYDAKRLDLSRKGPNNKFSEKAWNHELVDGETLGCKYLNREKRNYPLKQISEPIKLHSNSVFSIEVVKSYNFYELIDTGFDLSIKKNENFTKILKPYGINEGQMYNLDRYLKKELSFNLQRDVRPGKKYALFLSKNDSINNLECFAYEINAEKYLFVNMKDSIYAKIHVREPVVKTKQITGIINSSLWIALEKSGLSTNLEIDAIVDEITEKIYPWTINFYKIYPEDRFKIIYDAKYINGKFYEIEKVHASIFSHNGKDNYAIAFSEDNKKDYEYYDQGGNNLRKFFLTAPVSYKRISSKFSNSRKHPVTGKTKAHKGTDFAAKSGSEIYATADGIIEKADYTNANGYYVKIKHNNTYSTQYLHMNKPSKLFWEKNNIKPGKKIKQKDVIGYVGSTGLATGPHVCYRFWKNGEQVDPFKCALPPSEPINQSAITKFNIERSKWMLKLDSILYEDELIIKAPIEVSSHRYP